MMLRIILVSLLGTAVATPLARAQFSLLASLADVSNNAQSSTIQNFLGDGPDLIVALGGTNLGGGIWDGHAINRVSGLGGTTTVTTLMASAAWGTAFFSPIHSFQKSGNLLQFGSTGTQLGVFTFDLVSNTLATRFNTAGITSATGQSGFGFLGAAATDSAGEFVFGNSHSSNRSLLRTNGTAVDILLNTTDVTNLLGDSSINALGILGDTVYLANNTTDRIATYSLTNQASAVILQPQDLIAVNGDTSITYSRVYGGADGRVYFYTTDDDVWSFDPANPSGSLRIDFNTGGPNLQAFGWYDGKLAFATVDNLIYSVPEPAAGAVWGGLAVFGLVAWRRFRRAA